jgi:hypothetical protein
MAQGDLSKFSQEIQAFMDQLSELDQAIVDVYNLRGVATATGQTLDYVGDQVGELRPTGADDNTYRLLIIAKIQMNNSGGEPERLIAVVEALTGASSSQVSYTDYPGMVSLEYAGNVIQNLYTFIKRITAGGIGLRLVQVDSVIPFEFDSLTNGLDNGKLGNLITN